MDVYKAQVMEGRMDGYILVHRSSDGWKDGWMDICIVYIAQVMEGWMDLYIAQDGWKEGFGSSLFL